MKNKTGKLIILDGIDGSGKATQAKMLWQRLRDSRIPAEMADFPQYGQKSAGLVENYLNGIYGSAERVGPYRASIFYAADRYDASFKIKQWLREGKVVIANRYVSSNMAHQGGKIGNPLERGAFLDWLSDLEYGLFGIPKPDLSIILHVDPENASRLVEKKNERRYLNGKSKDIHEANLEHLRNAEKIYLNVVAKQKNACLVECVENDRLKTKSEIHESVWNKIASVLDINPPVKDGAGLRIRHMRNDLDQFIGRQSRENQSINKPLIIDLCSAGYYSLIPFEKRLIRAGIKIKIPEACLAVITESQDLLKQGGLILNKSLAPGYQEVVLKLVNLTHDLMHVRPGQKLARLMLKNKAL